MDAHSLQLLVSRTQPVGRDEGQTRLLLVNRDDGQAHTMDAGLFSQTVSRDDGQTGLLSVSRDDGHALAFLTAILDGGNTISTQHRQNLSSALTIHTKRHS
ncbi:hypothetical protein KP509_34G049700 [Ceratopteris richardii]|uniref:Uncharacterized protein n=1 Tax=Ceratopteris richardii TaxID=49495 RepID=A0A8T2QLR3_CERRI|nr:hypothetical protein KP509_34G049700 [Ceratopteris richardii]